MPGGGLTFYTAVLDRVIVVPYAVAEVEGEVRLLVRLDAALYHGRRHSRARRCRATSLLAAKTKKARQSMCVHTPEKSHSPDALGHERSMVCWVVWMARRVAHGQSGRAGLDWRLRLPASRRC